jgi:hypothetical protein
LSGWSVEFIFCSPVPKETAFINAGRKANS